MKAITKGLFILLSLIAISSQATTRYWNGSVDNLYTNAANWDGGVVPINNDYSDKIYFNDTKLSGATSKTPTLTSSRQIGAIVFQNSGYSILGSQIITKYLNSSGIGTNFINSLKSRTSSYTWTIGTGNTLIVGDLYQDGSNTKLTFKGGGTIVFNSYINGYTSINYQQIDDATMIVKANKVYKNNYVTKLTQESSELQLQTTVIAAEALITAGRITESIGNGLNVTDIGDGYVSIKIAPPKIPGTIIMID